MPGTSSWTRIFRTVSPALAGALGLLAPFARSTIRTASGAGEAAIPSPRYPLPSPQSRFSLVRGRFSRPLDRERRREAAAR